MRVKDMRCICIVYVLNMCIASTVCVRSLETRSVEVDTELLRLGEQLISSIEGSRAVALELCRGFETKFCEHLDGTEVSRRCTSPPQPLG